MMTLPIVPGPLPSAPLVSILTANYNYARYLPAAVASAQAQTYPEWEMIICDDGSADNSAEVIRRLALSEPRVRPVLQSQNGGMAAALNAAFAVSCGELICLLDADDTWTPDKLEQLVSCARQNPDAGLLPHPVSMVDSAGHRVAIGPRRPLIPGWHGPTMAAIGAQTPCPPSAGLSLRRAVAVAIFPLPETFRVMADAAIREVGAALTTLAPVSQSPLGFLRVHGENATTNLPGHGGWGDRECLLLQKAFELAAAKSQLPGPWPLPWTLLALHAINDRRKPDFRWKRYYRLLNSSPSRTTVSPLKRHIVPWILALPPWGLALALALPQRLASVGERFATSRRTESAP